MFTYVFIEKDVSAATVERQNNRPANSGGKLFYHNAIRIEAGKTTRFKT